MSLTNFPNGISSFGVPVMGGNGIPATKGKVFFVDYGSGIDGAGRGKSSAKPLKTIAAAYDLCTTNNDDVIVLQGSASHVLTAMLTVSKNRVHFVGMDGTTGRLYGQNAKIHLGVTTAVTDIATVKNTGVRNSFTNIKFTNANTLAQCLYTFVDGGECTLLSGCEIYKESQLTVTGAAELVMNGDSSQIVDCTIGSNANAITGTIIRPNVLFTKELAGTGKVSRDVLFKGCKFWRSSGHVNNRFAYGANATDIERMLLFEDCVFFNTKLAAALPAQCVAFGAEQTQGFALIRNCTGINVTKLSTTTGVYVDGAVPTYATTGIAVAA